jgi:hypothetical protein
VAKFLFGFLHPQDQTDLTEKPSNGGAAKKVVIQPIKMSLKNETDNEEQLILEDECHQVGLCFSSVWPTI